MIKCCKHAKSMEDNSKIPAGIFMKFKNGNEISIQWGMENYCTNRSETQEETLTAEIMISDAKGNCHMFGNDTGETSVKGWCSADEVAKWIYFTSTSRINTKSSLEPQVDSERYLDKMGDTINEAQAQPAR